MKPPPVIDSARVIQYAIVPEHIKFTSKHSLYVDGVLLGRVPRLTICENLSQANDILLFHCDASWNVLGISGAASIEETRRMAEADYPGIGQHWQDLDVSLEEAIAYYDADSKGFICSICGKRPYEVEGLIQGPDFQICHDCAHIFYNVFI